MEDDYEKEEISDAELKSFAILGINVAILSIGSLGSALAICICLIQIAFFAGTITPLLISMLSWVVFTYGATRIGPRFKKQYNQYLKDGRI